MSARRHKKGTKPNCSCKLIAAIFAACQKFRDLQLLFWNLLNIRPPGVSNLTG